MTTENSWINTTAVLDWGKQAHRELDRFNDQTDPQCFHITHGLEELNRAVDIATILGPGLIDYAVIRWARKAVRSFRKHARTERPGKAECHTMGMVGMRTIKAWKAFQKSPVREDPVREAFQRVEKLMDTLRRIRKISETFEKEERLAVPGNGKI